MGLLHASEETAKRILRAVRRVEQMPHKRTRTRRRMLPPAAGSVDKILYWPLEDSDNYQLPQDIVTGSYAYEVSPHATLITSIDYETEYEVVDCFGTICLPGQKAVCRYSAAFSAYIPFPHGQNAVQLARTYKTISAGDIVDGSDVWLLGSSDGILLNEIVEVSSFVNDIILFDHCHSDTDIVASQSEPADIYLQLFHENGGAQLRVVGRQCNP